MLGLLAGLVLLGGPARAETLGEVPSFARSFARM
jgi:hypothetical protein